MAICVSRIYLYPHHGENWKFLRGRGLKGLGNSSGVRGLKTKLYFQRACTTVVSHPLLWVILVLSLAMLPFFYHALAQNDFFFFNKSCFKTNLPQIMKERSSILYGKLATIAHYQSPQITTNRRGYLWPSLIFDASFSKEIKINNIEIET